MPEDRIAEEIKIASNYKIEIWDPKTPDLRALANDISNISRIDIEAFGEVHGLNIPGTIEFFRLFPDATTVIIRDGYSNEIVGFTIAEPLETEFQENIFVGRIPSRTTAYITKTAIASKLRGKHLFEKMMSTLESELKRKDYEYIEADVAAYALEGKESLADQIIRNNPNRILVIVPHDSPLGKQLFIRMKL